MCKSSESQVSFLQQRCSRQLDFAPSKASWLDHLVIRHCYNQTSYLQYLLYMYHVILSNTKCKHTVLPSTLAASIISFLTGFYNTCVGLEAVSNLIFNSPMTCPFSRMYTEMCASCLTYLPIIQFCNLY